MKKSILYLVFSLLLSTLAFAQPGSAPESVNINKASAQQIAATLNGVGLKKAEAIVQYRKEKGAFGSVDALAAVRGIGESTVEKNRNKIRIR